LASIARASTALGGVALLARRAAVRAMR